MIHLADTCPPSASVASAGMIASVADPLAGPGRARCPRAAMARDLQDIVAVRGAVDEADLLARGWTADAIGKTLPHAIALAQGDETLAQEGGSLAQGGQGGPGSLAPAGATTGDGR